MEILSESAAWAEIEGCSLVTGEHVKKAIQEKIYRSNKYDKKLLETFRRWSNNDRYRRRSSGTNKWSYNN